MITGFENWDIGQPQWSSPYGEEECIFLGHKSLFNLKWHDHRCNYNGASFICEYDKNAAPEKVEEEENNVKVNR